MRFIKAQLNLWIQYTALGRDAHRHEPLTLLSLQAGVPIALAKAGNNRAVKIAMTTSNSINVNAPNRLIAN